MSVAPPPEGRPWTVMRLVRWSTAYLADRGIREARHDVDRLLADALGIARLQLYLDHDRPLEPRELARFKERLLRRARREPIQYILGRAPFRDLELEVDPRVLIPRPETEILVDEVLRWAADRSGEGPLTAWDVGTGSGAIALSLLVEGSFTRVVASDLSDEALELARDNAEAAGVDGSLELRPGSLFEAARPGERFDVVVSNPPYVAEAEKDDLPPEVREWEPATALFAGPEGLDAIRAIAQGAPSVLRPGGLLALEVGAAQAGRVMDLLDAIGEYGTVRVREDRAGRERVVAVERRPAHVRTDGS